METSRGAPLEIDGRYRIVRPLGSGGMGHVYEALDLTLDRRVAVKVLLPSMQADPRAQMRLMGEGRAAARVRHRNVVQIYDVGCDGENDYIVMELLEGEDLFARIRRQGPMSVDEVRWIARRLAEALIAMHEAGIVHRDLKPRNIFLSQTGGLEELKVLDFGVAKASSGADVVTGSGEVLGTLQYMAPEQLRGGRFADVRSDIWAVGAILFEALTGEPPFHDDSAPALVLKIATEPAPTIAHRRRDLPLSLQQVIDRCLQRNTRRRFQTAADLLAALDADGCRPMRLQGWVGTTAALAIGALAAFYALRNDATRAVPTQVRIAKHVTRIVEDTPTNAVSGPVPESAERVVPGLPTAAAPPAHLQKPARSQNRRSTRARAAAQNDRTPRERASEPRETTDPPQGVLPANVTPPAELARATNEPSLRRSEFDY